MQQTRPGLQLYLTVQHRLPPWSLPPWHPCCQGAFGAMWLPVDAANVSGCTNLAVGFAICGFGGGLSLHSYSTLGHGTSHFPLSDMNKKKKIKKESFWDFKNPARRWVKPWWEIEGIPTVFCFAMKKIYKHCKPHSSWAQIKGRRRSGCTSTAPQKSTIDSAQGRGVESVSNRVRRACVGPPPCAQCNSLLLHMDEEQYLLLLTISK